MKYIVILIICAYTAINLVTSKMLNAKGMKARFIDRQCLVGKIFTNIFYLPAWILKGVRLIVGVTIK